MQKDKTSQRSEFLFRMYDQMFNDINRHMNIVWQPITVLIGSFALLAASVQDLLSIDISISLIVILVGWLLANLYDSSYWYNRNLVIIANIERQFLRRSDLKEIHYYFGKHRSKHSMITYIRIQWWLGMFIGGLILVYHFVAEVLDIWFEEPSVEFRFEMLLPYVTASIVAVWLINLKKKRVESYAEFLENSPGKNINAEGIKFGVGHPVDDDSDDN